MKNLVLWLLLMLFPVSQVQAINKISITPNFKEADGTKIPIKMKDASGGSWMQSVAIGELGDGEGREVFHSIFGEITTGERRDYINVAFQYSVSDHDVTTLLTGTGTVDHSNGSGIVETGTGVGLASIISNSTARYVTGHEMVVMFTADFAVPEVNVTQKLGIGDGIDGLAGFGYNGTVFGIWILTVDGGLEHIPQDTWITDKLDGTGISEHTLNPNAFNIYMVRYGWGMSPISFSIYAGADKGWLQVHVIDGTNTAENPHLGNPTLPVIMEIERTSGTGIDLGLKSSSWRASILGKVQNGTLADRTFLLKVNTVITGSNVPIWSMKSKDTFQGIQNHVRTRLATITFATDGTKAVEIEMFVGGVLVGGTFVDYDTNNSVNQFNVTATSYTPPAGELPIGATVLAKVDGRRINLIEGDIVISIRAGETVTIMGSTVSGSSDLIMFIRILEEF